MNIKENDVVQIFPDHDFGGCFVTVTEVKDWGIKGFIRIPLSGPSYVRLLSNEYKKVGKSSFIFID